MSSFFTEDPNLSMSSGLKDEMVEMDENQAAWPPGKRSQIAKTFVWTSLEGIRKDGPRGEGGWVDSSEAVSQSFQLLSHVRLFATPWTAARQASLSITNSQSLLKLMSIELVMPSNHLILCHPLLFLPSIFSNITVFSNESVLHIRWPKYWSFILSISPFSEHPGLISFRSDWLDLLAVQGTLKSLLQHHSSKASILWCSAFFIIQLSIDSSSMVLRGNRFVQESWGQLSGCWKDPSRVYKWNREGTGGQWVRKYAVRIDR